MTDFLVMEFAHNKLHFPWHGCMLTWLATMMAPSSGDIGIRGTTSGLATVPQGATEPLVVRDRDGRGPASVCVAVVHCREILG